MLELRTILTMTVRDFDIDSEFPADSPRTHGELAFQTMQPGQLSAYPKDSMPVRVRIRKRGLRITTRFYSSIPRGCLCEQITTLGLVVE